MIIEIDNGVLLEEGQNLAEGMVGDIWITFQNSIPPLQVKELDRSFNLILMAVPESNLPQHITAILIDDQLELATKKQTIYLAMATNIIELLANLGVTLFDEVVGEDKLTELNTLAEFFFDLREYEDLIGLRSLLEALDIPPVDRFLQAMTVYWGEDFDLTEYECLIEDVSEVTIKSIKDALFNPDDVETPPESLQRRIIENKDFLKDTLAYSHVTSNGQLGGSMNSFMNFFRNDLEEMVSDQSEAGILKHAKEILGFFIISDINNEWLKDKATKYLYTIVTDYIVLTKVEALIEEVIIPT